MTSGHVPEERVDVVEVRVRLRAMMHRIAAAHLDAAVQMRRTGLAFQSLADAWRNGEVREVQQHPDLAELDAQLDGFYS